MKSERKLVVARDMDQDAVGPMSFYNKKASLESAHRSPEATEVQRRLPHKLSINTQ